MLKKAIVIFSGYNQRAVIAFCRVARKQDIPLIIIAKSEEDSIFNTEYGKYVKHVRVKLELDITYIKQILKTIKEKEAFEKYFILPSSEALNRFLLDNRYELEKMNFIVPLTDKDKYELISDKYAFGSFCKRNGIKIPDEYGFDRDLEFPAVIKSKRYFTKNGEIVAPQIVKSLNEYKEFTKKYDSHDFYIQEFLRGESYYLLYYFCKDGTYQAFSQKNILQQSRGKSILAAIPSNLNEKYISDRFVRLFKSLCYTGLVMIEIKYYNDQYYMIEANPRLWGPSQLFVDSGCVFFESYLKDMGFDINMDICGSRKTGCKYLWLGGIIESLYEYGEIVFHIDDSNFIMNQFKDFLSYDIYLREDTKDLFTKEIASLTGRDSYGNR